MTPLLNIEQLQARIAQKNTLDKKNFKQIREVLDKKIKGQYDRVKTKLSPQENPFLQVG